MRGRRHPRGLIESIQNLVQVSWLSIHRFSGSQRSSDDKSYESTVDRKLEQQSNDLLKYFSSLSQQKDEEVRRFQELIFLSLLDETGTTQLFTARTESDLAMQRIALEEIFRELKVSEKSFSEPMRNFFGHSEQIAAKLRASTSSGFTTEELSNLVGQYRLNNVIDRRQTLNDEGLFIRPRGAGCLNIAPPDAPKLNETILKQRLQQRGFVRGPRPKRKIASTEIARRMYGKLLASFS